MPEDKGTRRGKAGDVEASSEGSVGDVSGAMERSHDMRVSVISGRRSPFPIEKGKEGQKAGDASSGMAKMVPPPYDPALLLEIVSESSILGACIESMKVNVDGLGYTLIERSTKGDKKAPKDYIVAKERAEIIAFIENINYDESLSSLRMKVRGDLESVGFGGWEFVRDGGNKIVEINWIPARYLRMTKQDKEYTPFKQKILVGKELKDVNRRKRFRRFAWVSTGGGVSADVYYKELGDPRAINCETGEADDSLKPGDEKYATEVYMFKLIDKGAAYPEPRWMGALLSAIGQRRTEELNYTFFENNLFVPIAILVSGGQITEQSMEKIKEVLEEGKGWTEAGKALIIEAYGAETAEELFREGRASGVKIEVKELVNMVKEDALFQGYDKGCRDKQRLPFRLPSILLGMSEDYNRGTAEAALSIVNAQVFGVERDEFDSFMNRIIFPLKGFKHHKFKSLSFKASDPQAYATTLMMLSDMGILTPATGQPFASELLGADIPLPDEPYIYHPFKLMQTIFQMGLAGIENYEDSSMKVPGQFQGKGVARLFDMTIKKQLMALRRGLILQDMMPYTYLAVGGQPTDLEEGKGE